MEEEHLEHAELARFRRGELTPAEVMTVWNHLAACEACRNAGRANGDAHASGVADHLLRDSTGDHPDVETTLTGYVDGTLPFDAQERVEAHLGICERCRGDADDLREVAASMTRPQRARRPRRLLLAIAASIIVAVTSLLLLRPRSEDAALPPLDDRLTTTSPPTTQEPALKPEWQSLIATTLRRGSLPLPAVLREVRGTPETIRGQSPRAVAISPAEEVVESDRPVFIWPAQNNATAVVFVYRGDQELVVSESIRANTWTPSKPLPRGVPLVWQVELRAADGSIRVVPAAPDPPAMFRILDETSRREIEEVSRLQPPNDLLLGILYARSGLKERAIEALRRHASTHPEAIPLVRSVEQWR